MAIKPITVSQLNDYISRVIGTDPLLGAVVVKGEISGLKYHDSGNVYFSIIDGLSKINCFLAEEYKNMLHYSLDNGMEVVLNGNVRVYKKNGSYSLYVTNVEVSGEGSLAIAFQKMKSKLDQEGFFDKRHKKPIPEFPEKIGVITSNTGAAVRDILKIIRQRNDYVNVTVFPVLVQGEYAAENIAGMIDYVNKHFEDIDTLIVGRGGGSTEDLWAFNEEVVARSIYDSRIPVISAVGHEIDFTIADFVADKRAETPTAAAQMAVPDTAELRKILNDKKENLLLQLANKVRYNMLCIENMSADLKTGLQSKIQKYEHKIEEFRLMLEKNNPLRILDEGYAVVTDQDEKTVKSVLEFNLDQTYKIQLKDGFAKCNIVEVNNEKIK